MYRSIFSNVMWLLFITPLLGTSCKSYAQNFDSEPISHEQWDRLLRDHVSPDGSVDYRGLLENREALQSYLDLLATHHPNDAHWTDAEQMAYWINAYNAFTVQLILDHYPLKSIKDIKKGLPMINSVWDIKFIDIEGQTYDLNNIEHSILRKQFDEPRIHFAINCASVSCPVLLNEAYTADRLEAQLESQAIAFISDPSRNRISPDKLELSKIFSWFKGDFTHHGSLREFIAQYSEVDIRDDARIDFLPYNWNLNE